MSTSVLNQYCAIKAKQPEMFECFFAFSNQQFEEGVKKTGIAGKIIYSGFGGLYGTNEGITKFVEHYDNLSNEISEKCLPQEVYEYEFWNHECSYVGSDKEAFDIVVSYFGEERVKEVKRKFYKN